MTKPQSLSKLALLLLVLLAGWSYARWLSARAAAATAAENLAECRRLARQINQLRDAPMRATAEAHSATELARRIEQAAQTAKMPIDRLIQIDPQPARRMGDSPYREQPTYLEFRDVPLPPLITFLHLLAQGDMGAECSEIRLRGPQRGSADPPGGQNQETWSAEVTLTHLIFSP